MRRLAVIAIVVIAAIGGAWLLLGRPGSGPAATPDPSLAPVPPSTEVVADGRVVPARYAELGAAVPGTIVEVLAVEGDDVAAGAALVRLDARDRRGGSGRGIRGGRRSRSGRDPGCGGRDPGRGGGRCRRGSRGPGGRRRGPGARGPRRTAVVGDELAGGGSRRRGRRCAGSPRGSPGQPARSAGRRDGGCRHGDRGEGRGGPGEGRAGRDRGGARPAHDRGAVRRDRRLARRAGGRARRAGTRARPRGRSGELADRDDRPRRDDGGAGGGRRTGDDQRSTGCRTRGSTGRSRRLALFGTSAQGDVVYRAIVTPSSVPDGIRWNMTATVTVVTRAADAGGGQIPREVPHSHGPAGGRSRVGGTRAVQLSHATNPDRATVPVIVMLPVGRATAPRADVEPDPGVVGEPIRTRPGRAPRSGRAGGGASRRPDARDQRRNPAARARSRKTSTIRPARRSPGRGRRRPGARPASRSTPACMPATDVRTGHPIPRQVPPSGRQVRKVRTIHIQQELQATRSSSRWCRDDPRPGSCSMNSGHAAPLWSSSKSRRSGRSASVTRRSSPEPSVTAC